MKKMYVITGGPGVGKTSVIDELRKQGYICVDEIARDIIREQIEVDGDALPWKNTHLYIKLMLERSVDSYKQHYNPKDILFFDRGIPDTLAYSYLIDLEDKEKEKIQRISNRYRYHKNVFLLPPWEEIYCIDSERKQSWEEAVQTYHVMKKSYQEVGYILIELPRMPLKERVEFIINHL